MSELADLFVKYGTPKDGYPRIYEILLGRHRQHITMVLEIGIGTMNPSAPYNMVDWALDGYSPGGSLRAWRDWFPNATITGLDVQSDTMFDEPRIRTRLGDSRNSADVHACLGWPNPIYDLIIDDGDHSAQGQLHTFRNLYPYLKPDGYYVIEDASELPTHPTAMEHLRNHVRGISDLTGSGAELIVYPADLHDLFNNLVVIQRGTT